MEKTILIDGNNLLHRAYFVFVKSFHGSALVNKSGYPTGLIYGSLSMLFSWIQEIQNPTGCAFFLDGMPKRRRLIDPNYKLKLGSELLSNCSKIKLSDGFEATNEIDVVIHILQLLGIPCYYSAEEEADDLIASYCHQNSENIHIIISSDKDFYQLVSDHVILYRPGLKGNRFYDIERVINDEKYGIHPNQIRMFKTLVGDPSDNIVGVPRLRRAVARKLSSAMSIDDLCANLSICSVKEKENILSNADKLRVNYELVRLIDDLPITSYVHRVSSNVDMVIKIMKDDLDISDISDIQINNVFKHINTCGFIKTGIVQKSLPNIDIDTDDLLINIQI
jgi:DNA polymerase-1